MMQRRRIVTVLGASAVAGALALSGCSSDAGDPGPGSSEGTTLTVWTWAQPASALKAAVPEFEEANPGITVDVQEVGNPAIWDKITTGMAAGGAGLPDIMHIGGDYISNYLETFPDGLANLSEMGADEYESDFASGIWKSGSTAAGEVYGIPMEATGSTIFTRKDLFEQAGVDMSSIATWDDLIEAGIDVKAATGADLLLMDKAATTADAANLWQILMQLQGGFYFNADGEITINSDEAITALSIIKKMNDAGIVADVPNDWNATIEALRSGRVAAHATGSWFAGAMVDEIPEMAGQWEVSLPPAVEAGGLRATTSGSYLSMSNASENKALAWEFIKFALTDLDSQLAMYEAAGLSPAYTPMYETDGFLEPSEYFNGGSPNAIAVDQLVQEDVAPTNFTSDYSRALKLYVDAQTQVLLSGADPDAVLNAAAQQLAQQRNRKIASN